MPAVEYEVRGLAIVRGPLQQGADLGVVEESGQFGADQRLRIEARTAEDVEQAHGTRRHVLE